MPASHLLHGHKTFPGEGIYVTRNSAFSQIREALGRHLSVPVDSYWPQTQNNPYAK